jgi:hypothetical protein
MPRGSKEKYTDKQKRQAEHIEEGYRERGLSEGEAEQRAWATVNKVHGGGENPAAAVTASPRITSRCGAADGTSRRSASARPSICGHPTGEP